MWQTDLHAQVNLMLTTYSVKGKILETYEQVRDLGLILQRDLCFSKHIEVLTPKANRSMGLV